MSLGIEPKRLAALTATVLEVGSSDAGGQESLAELLRRPAFEEVASLFRQSLRHRDAPQVAAQGRLRRQGHLVVVPDHERG